MGNVSSLGAVLAVAMTHEVPQLRIELPLDADTSIETSSQTICSWASVREATLST